MAINFNHIANIKSLKIWLPKYLKKGLGEEGIIFKKGPLINQVSRPYREGSGKNELLIFKHEIIINSIKIPLVFTENQDGVLAIKVGAEPDRLIKKMQGITNELLKELYNDIYNYVK